MIELYINNTKADLTGDESILFNRTRTDYTNPAIVKNSFSKTVTLPGTPVNDSIFGHIYMLCKSVTNKSKFNPSKRTPFVLTRDGAVVEEGYLKLDKIETQYDTHSYQCTLYGEMGNLLYGLSYKTDPSTGEQTEMTLADIFPGDAKFTINKAFVQSCWNTLASPYNYPTTEATKAYNFAVCYDGVPSADNFDPKKIWTDVKRRANVVYNNTVYHLSMPQGFTDDDTYYGYVSTFASRSDVNDDHYGLIELTEGAQPIEVRDFRSYLLRPLVKVSYIFDKIEIYLEQRYGYSLDRTDFFFKTSDYTDSYITLPMLYEIDKSVETGMEFTKEKLLATTGTPASYLISFCKVFGLYIDTNPANKTLTLTRTPAFFDRKSPQTVIADISNTISIKPLSFDKSSYTFDWGEGKGEFLETYKDKYSIAYGTKKINTGYTFDNSTQQYIQNNIFKSAVDTIEQNGFHRYHEIKETLTAITNSPVAVMAEINTPKFKLFKVDQSTHLPIFSDDGECETFEAEMYRSPRYTPADDSWGYLYPDNLRDPSVQWNGLKRSTWQDCYPRLQFHDSSRKGVDGSNVLVKFNSYFGSPRAVTGTCKTDQTTGKSTWKNYTSIYYLLTDDNSYLKAVIGKNCYIDNPTPTVGGDYITVIRGVPLFNRFDYTLKEENKVSNFNITKTLDFSYPRELYIPGAKISDMDTDVYNSYWKDLVADMYDINTRVFTADCKIDNITNAFRKFYIYDYSVWVMSSVSDYNIETGLGKFEFLKVNNIDHYTYTDGLYISRSTIGARKAGGEYYIDYQVVGDRSPITASTSSTWIQIDTESTPNTIELLISPNTAAFTRSAEVIISMGKQSYTIYIRQYGD